VLHLAKHIVIKLGTYSNSLLSLNVAHLVVDTFIKDAQHSGLATRKHKHDKQIVYRANQNGNVLKRYYSENQCFTLEF
jgi:hypothetical protein